MGYVGMCRPVGYGFSSCLRWDRVCKSESLGVEYRVSFSRKLMNWLNILG